MDLRQYFRKIEEVEKSIPERYTVVVSLETADGGKPGLASEVSRHNAARLIVEGRALLASADEKEAYVAAQLAAREAAEKAEMAKRLQLAVIPESEFRNISQRKKDTQK